MKICYLDEHNYFHVFEITEHGEAREWGTTRVHPNKYARFDDPENGYPQICKNGSRQGYTISYHQFEENIPVQFARDIGAKLYRTESGYNRAKARQLVESN